MKKLFSLALLAMMMVAGKSFAQSSIYAVLNHNDSLQVFYGIGALTSAYNQAKENDIITLSAGAFNSCSLQKSITIRGAGMGYNETDKDGKTELLGNFSIGVSSAKTAAGPDNVTITLEGIYHTATITYNALYKLNLIKCRVGDITERYWYTYNSYQRDGYISNGYIVNSYISGSIEAQTGTLYCFNSIVNDPYCSWLYSASNTHFELQNCIIFNKSRGLSMLTSSTITNCILVGYTDDNSLPSDSYANYSVSVGTNNNNVFGGSSTCQHVSDYSSIFKNYNGTYTTGESFELTDEAKTQYLGTDDKEVGVYGGNTPFDTTVKKPNIVKCDVAAKTTADGKLSVEIKVKETE